MNTVGSKNIMEEIQQTKDTIRILNDKLNALEEERLNEACKIAASVLDFNDITTLNNTEKRCEYIKSYDVNLNDTDEDNRYYKLTRIFTIFPDGTHRIILREISSNSTSMFVDPSQNLDMFTVDQIICQLLSMIKDTDAIRQLKMLKK